MINLIEGNGKEGNKIKFDEVYEQYGNVVFGYLMRLCKDKGTAEDLLQETFCQAVRCAKKYDGSCSVTTWLCSIAKNLWFQELRKKDKNQWEVLDESLISGEPAPEEALVIQTQALDVLQQIHSLPEKEKEVVLLRALGSLSFREIGQVMEKSENWARVTFFRAKQKIKEN